MIGVNSPLIMSRSRFEGEERSPIQPNGDIAPRPPLTLIEKLAHQQDSQTRQAVVLSNRFGEVIGGTGGNARPATLAEVAQVLNGGVHAPFDARSLEQPKRRLSHGDFVRASRQGQSAPVSDTQLPFSTDHKRIKAEREARKKAAKALKNKGNKGRKSA